MEAAPRVTEEINEERKPLDPEDDVLPVPVWPNSVTSLAPGPHYGSVTRLVKKPGLSR